LFARDRHREREREREQERQQPLVGEVAAASLGEAWGVSEAALETEVRDGTLLLDESRDSGRSNRLRSSSASTAKLHVHASSSSFIVDTLSPTDPGRVTQKKQLGRGGQGAQT
jgi:hypothetical protein